MDLVEKGEYSSDSSGFLLGKGRQSHQFKTFSQIYGILWLRMRSLMLQQSSQYVHNSYVAQYCDSCKICSIGRAGMGHNVRTQRYADQAYPRALGKIL